MKTVDMMKYANDEDMSYESSFGVYLPDEGFVINEYGKKCFDDDANLFLHMLLEDDTIWHPQPEQPKTMTLEEIEKELGYKIKLDNGNTEKTVIKDDKKDDKKKDRDSVRAMSFEDFLKYLLS